MLSAYQALIIERVPADDDVAAGAAEVGVELAVALLGVADFSSAKSLLTTTVVLSVLHSGRSALLEEVVGTDEVATFVEIVELDAPTLLEQECWRMFHCPTST